MNSDCFHPDTLLQTLLLFMLTANGVFGLEDRENGRGDPLR
jgi:hypothetical protein